MNELDSDDDHSNQLSITANEHLTFPSTSSESPQPEFSSSPRQLLKDRLYIGNLHPSVDEYSLLQVFSKFGKVTKLDFLFHKAGALKGKPRGYAFIEYGSNVEAAKALTMAHDKLLRGRKLVVTYAHQAPIEHGGTGAGGMKRKSMMETGRPTTLSLLKTSTGTRSDATTSKIAMMEAKLRQMERTNPKPAASPETLSLETSTATSNSRDTVAAPTAPTLHHPSLPSKPPAPFRIPESGSRPITKPRPKPALPSLPFAPSSNSKSVATGQAASTNTTARPAKPKLVGVKLGKAKEKERDKGGGDDTDKEKDERQDS